MKFMGLDKKYASFRFSESDELTQKLITINYIYMPSMMYFKN